MTRSAKPGSSSPVCDARKSRRPSPRPSGGLRSSATAMMIGINTRIPYATYVRGRRRLFTSSVRIVARVSIRPPRPVPRNASSRRRRAVTVSTRDAGGTSAATSSERRPPSIVTARPGGSSSMRRTDGMPSSTRRGSGGVVDLEVDRPGGTDELDDRAGRDQLALVHHDRVGADLLDLGQHVAREEHRGARLGDAPHELAHLAHLTGVEAVGRLVEHQDLGPAQQHACEPEPLAHALRVGLHLAVDGRPEIGDGQRLLEVGVGPSGRHPPPTTA